MSTVYTKDFILSLKNNYKVYPEEFKTLDIGFLSKIPINVQMKSKKHQDKNSSLFSNISEEDKKIMGILNKLTRTNYDVLLEQVKDMEYANTVVFNTMISKIIFDSVFFSELYAKFCYDLENLHPLLRAYCFQEFVKDKSKNLCLFVSELYKYDIIDIKDYVSHLLLDVDSNIESLHAIIMRINIYDELKNIILALDSEKTKFSSRRKFMIMDMKDKLDGKNVKKF